MEEIQKCLIKTRAEKMGGVGGGRVEKPQFSPNPSFIFPFSPLKFEGIQKPLSYLRGAFIILY